MDYGPPLGGVTSCVVPLVHRWERIVDGDHQPTLPSSRSTASQGYRYIHDSATALTESMIQERETRRAMDRLISSRPVDSSVAFERRLAGIDPFPRSIPHAQMTVYTGSHDAIVLEGERAKRMWIYHLGHDGWQSCRLESRLHLMLHGRSPVAANGSQCRV